MKTMPILALATLLPTVLYTLHAAPPTAKDRALTIIKSTQPLAHPRGERMPLMICRAAGLAPADDAEAEKILKDLDARGIALFSYWNAGRDKEKVLAEGLRIGRLQKKLELPIYVDANRCFHLFFNGDPRTAHIDADGKPFFDTTFTPGRTWQRKMGCPFKVHLRSEAVRGQLTYFLEAYKKAGLTVELVYGDWEIDGPLEWNGAWEHSQKCVTCRKNIKKIDDFGVFQKTLRDIRNKLQHDVFVKTIHDVYPNCLVGNYAEYPHNGIRYWYDWFEVLPEDAPFIREHGAKHRPWVQGFDKTGYTLAMPVVYAWGHIWKDYPFEDTDYRWVYGMLRPGNNALQTRDERGKATPIVPFVHFGVTSAEKAGEGHKPPTERAYREFLWHLMLRGCNSLIMWCAGRDLDHIAEETKPVHQVWAASLQYKEFLDKGKVVTFDIPNKPADLISAVVLADKVLVRRSAFGKGDKRPIKLTVGNKTVTVPVFTDECRILELER